MIPAVVIETTLAKLTGASATDDALIETVLEKVVLYPKAFLDSIRKL